MARLKLLQVELVISHKEHVREMHEIHLVVVTHNFLYSRGGRIGPRGVSVPPNKTTGLIEMVTTSPKTGLDS